MKLIMTIIILWFATTAALAKPVKKHDCKSFGEVASIVAVGRKAAINESDITQAVQGLIAASPINTATKEDAQTVLGIVIRSVYILEPSSEEAHYLGVGICLGWHRGEPVGKEQP